VFDYFLFEVSLLWYGFDQVGFCNFMLNDSLEMAL
jgi:hypothetical protein